MRKLLLLLSRLPSVVMQAQDVPPPPRPDNGPSLAETIRYIQDRLNSARFHYLRVNDGKPSDTAYEYSNVRVDGSCIFSYETQRTIAINGVLSTAHLSEIVPLRDVASVSVESVVGYYNLKITMVPGKIVKSEGTLTRRGDGADLRH